MILINQWKRILDRVTALCLYGNLVYENGVTSNQQLKRNSTNYIGILGYPFDENN